MTTLGGMERFMDAMGCLGGVLMGEDFLIGGSRPQLWPNGLRTHAVQCSVSRRRGAPDHATADVRHPLRTALGRRRRHATPHHLHDTTTPARKLADGAVRVQHPICSLLSAYSAPPILPRTTVHIDSVTC